MTMKMNLRSKATLLVALITFMQADNSCCRFLESMGLGKVVLMRDSKGKLTREGQAVMSLFFAMLSQTNMMFI